MIKARKDQAVQAFKEAQSKEAEEQEPESLQEAAPESSPRLVRPAAAREPNESPSAASPWASSAPQVVPKAVLPSALAPAAEPATVTSEAPIGAGATKRRKLPRWALPVLAVLAVIVPLVGLWLAMRPAAAVAYRAAAQVAKRADVLQLLIEALRMAGTCLLLAGSEEGAIFAWQEAVSVVRDLGAREQGGSTLVEVKAALRALLKRHGLGQQVAHVQSLVAC